MRSPPNVELRKNLTGKAPERPFARARSVLPRRQDGEGGVARSLDRLVVVRNCRPAVGNLPDLGVGDRFQVDEGQLVHAVAVAEILAGQCCIMTERLVRRVWTAGGQRRVALVLSPPPAPRRFPPTTARASCETRADDPSQIMARRVSGGCGRSNLQEECRRRL